MNHWEQLYQEGDTGWEKGEASPGLLEWLEPLEGPPGLNVLVPGCGFGHDVRALAGAGFEVVGYDIAPSAVAGARERTPAELKGATFRGGDFLCDEPLDQFDYLFEHTCFCAIDPSERDAYVAAVRRWLKPGGRLLAIHYMLPPGEEGPPFGVDRVEVIDRFSGYFSLLDDWTPVSWPNREGLEHMFHWQLKR